MKDANTLLEHFVVRQLMSMKGTDKHNKILLFFGRKKYFFHKGDISILFAMCVKQSTFQKASRIFGKRTTQQLTSRQLSNEVVKSNIKLK